MTKIEWCDETWNPITGCTPISEACENCYAKRMANRLKGRYGYPSDEPFRVTLHPDKLDDPKRWRKPRRIFVCSMSDLFHDNISPGQIHEIWDVMKACPQHVFMVLTKRPERMKEVLEHIYRLERFGAAVGFWSHVWLGVTAENQRRLDERVKILLQITAAVRFVSIEPMLGPVDLHNFLPHVSSCRCPECYHRSFKSKPAYTVDWVIAGGETGPGARPIHPDWVWDLRDQCVSMSIPFFFKGWGSWMGTSAIERRLLDGREWNEFPKWEVK